LDLRPGKRFAKGGQPTRKLQIVAVPEGPYKTQMERWNAIFTFQEVNINRMREGIKPFTDGEIKSHMQMDSLQIEREICTEGYKKLRLAKSASNVQQSIADVAPIVRRTITEVANQIEAHKKCSLCGSVGIDDLKKRQEWLNFTVSVMDKFGLDKIDVSYAENNDEMDIDAQIAEAVEIIEEARKWPNLAPQRVVKALVESNVGGEKRKVVTPVADTGDSTGDADAGPDEVIHSIRSPETAVYEQEKVPGNDIQQPVGEDRLVDGGPNTVCQGDTPGGEDTQERSNLDIGREERQDTPGIGAEVPGETGAKRIQMGIQ